jgi:hypothetical protein
MPATVTALGVMLYEPSEVCARANGEAIVIALNSTATTKYLRCFESIEKSSIVT